MTSIELDARKADFIRKLLNDINNESEMKKLENTLKKIVEVKGRGDAMAPVMNITQAGLDYKISEALQDDDLLNDEQTTLFYVRWATEK